MKKTANWYLVIFSAIPFEGYRKNTLVKYEGYEVSINCH